MSHGASAGVLAAIAAPNVTIVLAVDIAFNGGTVRVNSTDREITIGGFIYGGVGKLGQITELEESGQLQASGMRLALYGIPNNLVGIALGEQYQGKIAQVWIVILDQNYATIASPILGFSGTVDTVDIVIGKTTTVSVNVENVLADWERPRIRRYTDEDQQAYFPGDEIFKYVASMIEKEITWGRS